jgi:hypothetical protein
MVMEELEPVSLFEIEELRAGTNSTFTIPFSNSSFKIEVRKYRKSEFEIDIVELSEINSFATRTVSP